MPTTIRLDDSKILQLIRNTKLWLSFPLFKNMALKVQSAETKIAAAKPGCPICATRKRKSAQNKLTDVVSVIREAIIHMPNSDKEKLKKALGVDYIKITVIGDNNRPKELMY